MASNIQSVIHGYDRQKEEEQARLIAQENKLPYVNLVNYPFTGDVIGLIPLEIAKKFSVVAFQQLGNTIHVATPYPYIHGLADSMNEIGEKNNVKFAPHYCSQTSIEYALKQYEKLVKKAVDTSAHASSESVQSFLANISSLKDLSGVIQEMSATKLFETILSGSLAFDATDIHFEPQAGDVRVRFRIDGDLQDVAQISDQAYRLLLSRVKNLSKLKLNRMPVPQDGRFSISLDKNSKIDVRVNVLPTTYGETTELRLLTGKGMMTLDKLGLNPKTEEAIQKTITRQNGMIIITGPTGSGKTTTLYAVLKLLNTPERKIITIEDPVEYRIVGIEQIQIDASKGFDFAQALRAVLRQDPDVILVGEIRDEETAEIAINASLTGHLVLSTLHANSAPATFARLIEMGAPTNLLADAISLVVAQRLVKKKRQAGDIGASVGRTVISEYLEPDQDFSQLIKSKATIREFQTMYEQKGYKSLKDDLELKKQNGEVDLNETYQ